MPGLTDEEIAQIPDEEVPEEYRTSPEKVRSWKKYESPKAKEKDRIKDKQFFERMWGPKRKEEIPSKLTPFSASDGPTTTVLFRTVDSQLWAKVKFERTRRGLSKKQMIEQALEMWLGERS